MCPANDNNKNRKSTRDKASISNSKVNRGYVPLTANRTPADCVQISLGPSIPYILQGVYYTGELNAMCKYLPMPYSEINDAIERGWWNTVFCDLKYIDEW